MAKRAQARLNAAVMDWLKVYEDGNRMDTSDGAVVRCELGMAARAFIWATTPKRRKKGGKP